MMQMTQWGKGDTAIYTEKLTTSTTKALVDLRKREQTTTPPPVQLCRPAAAEW